MSSEKVPSKENLPVEKETSQKLETMKEDTKERSQSTHEEATPTEAEAEVVTSLGSSSCKAAGDEDDDEDSSDEDTEEQDSDDDSDAVRETPAEVVVAAPAAEVTSDMNLLEQSELSLLGVASEEFLIEHLDSLPVELPDARKRQHVAVLQRRHEVPPQSPRLALLELNTAPLFRDEPIEQDPRLANWERWLADRRRQHRHFAERSPRSLAMNSGEDTRYLLERKQILDYARIPAPPDYFRGGPDFWRLPFFLPDHCGDADEPIYAAQRTLPDRGIVPTTEYVGVPDHVRKEKEVFGKLDRRSPRDIWHSNVYMQQERAKMADRYVNVEPHEPDMRDLVIVGNYWQKMEVPASCDVPVLTVSQEPVDMREREYENELTASLMSMIREENEGRPKTFRDLDGVACLRIQERDFYYVEPPKSRKIAMKMARERLLRLYNAENPLEFRLSFSSPTGRIETKILRLENRGTVKVSYSWRRCVDKEPDFPVAVTLRSDAGAAQHFFFNKNKDLLLPGQVVEFRFMYRSHYPGVFQESWMLLTEPCFVDDDDVFTVQLWGVTTPQDVRDELSRLRGHVTRRVEEALAREAIYVALENAKYPTYHDPPYGQNFLTEAKFRHVNPDYNFDGDLVKQLCEIHGVISTQAKLPDWDLKIPTLRQIIVDHTDGETRRNHLDTLSEIAIRLRQHAYVTRDGTLRKYTCVYNLLCSFANTIDREGHKLKVTYGLSKREETPLEVKYEKAKAVTPDRRPSSAVVLKRPKSKPKVKRGGKATASATRDLNKTSRSLKDSSSSSSLSEDAHHPPAPVTSDTTAVPTLSVSKLQSLTALFTPAAGFSESTTRLLSTLTASNTVEPVPSLPMLPITLPASDEMPSAVVDDDLVRRVYRQSLYVMVKEALCHTVEHISAVLDSYKQI